MWTHHWRLVNDAVRRDGWKCLLGVIEKLNQDAMQQKKRDGYTLGDHGVKADRAERDIADAIALQIIAFVTVPIITNEKMIGEFTIGADIKGVSREVVILKLGIITI